LLELDLSTIIFSLINFTLLIFLLYKLLYKRLLTAMNNRQKNISKSFAVAQKAREDAASTKIAMAAQIDETYAQAKEIIENGKRAGEAAKNDIIEQAQKAAQVTLTQAQLAIERQKAQAIADIKAQAAQMIITVSEKMIRESISQEQQKFLVDKYIQEVDGLQ